MTRRLTDEQVQVLFFGHLHKTGDLEAAIALVYEAGRSSATTAALQASARHRRGPVRSLALTNRVMAIRANAAPFLGAVARRHNLTVDHMLTGATREACTARFEAQWLLRQAGLSFPAIAVATHREDHTTAINGVRRGEVRIAADVRLRGELLGLVPAARVLRRVAA